jgi:hypothetical protein
MIKKSFKEFLTLAWTLGGTGLVLITLSGDTRTAGLWITGASIVLHFASVLIPWDESDDSEQSEG